MVSEPKELDQEIKISWKMLLYAVVMSFMLGALWTKVLFQDVFMRAELDGLRNDVNGYIKDVKEDISANKEDIKLLKGEK